MKNYIYLDGKKVPISDETANSFKEQFREEEWDVKAGDMVYWPGINAGGYDTYTSGEATNLSVWESLNKTTIERAENFILLQNYADKVNGEFGGNKYYIYHGSYGFEVSYFIYVIDNNVYFSSEKLAQQAIDHFGKDFFMKLFNVV